MGDRYRVLAGEKNSNEYPEITEIDLSAINVSYDNTYTGLSATTVQDAIDSVSGDKIGDTQSTFWDYSVSSGGAWLYCNGQLRGNGTPFISPKAGSLDLVTAVGVPNNTSTGSSIHFGIYKFTAGSVPTLGTLPTYTRDYVIYTGSEFYGSTVTVILKNNGVSKPLAFSEDLSTKTVTIQLATNSSGTVTTTSTTLVTAFRLENTITLIWKMNLGAGSQILTPGTFTIGNGTQGNSVGSIILRGNACYSRVKSLSIPLSILDAIAVYVLPYDNGSYSNVSVTTHMLFKR